MQERVAQVPHRSGLLKQTNKKHKTGGHRSKVSQMRPYRCKIKCKTKHANIRVRYSSPYPNDSEILLF